LEKKLYARGKTIEQPFYCEFPYIPWLGSLVQFATQPREFLTRAAARCGNVFTIQLFGRKMTFLMGTDGHAHFFRAKEDVFDIREACTYLNPMSGSANAKMNGYLPLSSLLLSVGWFLIVCFFALPCTWCFQNKHNTRGHTRTHTHTSAPNNGTSDLFYSLDRLQTLWRSPPLDLYVFIDDVGETSADSSHDIPYSIISLSPLHFNK